jgi:DNA-binding CsgD family transcriptional regulator
MSPEFGLHRIEQAFLSAAFDPTLWNVAMDVAAQESGGVGSILLPVDEPLPAVPSSSSLGEASEYYFEQEWHRRDERYRGVPALKTRGIVVDFDFFTNEEIERHPYYREFLGRFGLRWFAGVPIRTPNGTCCLSIQRTIKQGPFSKSQQQRLAQWGSRLSVHATLAHHLGRARVHGAMDLLENLGAPAIILGAFGRVLRVNGSAEQRLCPELQIRNGRLSVADREASDQIANALRRIMESKGARALGPVAIPRRARRPIILRFIRIDGIDANPFLHASVIALIADTEADARPHAEEFSRLFGLTTAEARLARLLSAGEDLAHAAENLHITGETARSRLKSIYAKTDTHKQGALVALFSRIEHLF